MVLSLVLAGRAGSYISLGEIQSFSAQISKKLTQAALVAPTFLNPYYFTVIHYRITMIWVLKNIL